MGRSKFPGKPSKLVNKKRISVLQGNESNLFLSDDGDYMSNDHISFWNSENGTSTFGRGNGDTQNSCVSQSREKPSSSEPPDGGGGGGIGKNRSIYFSRVVTRARNTTSHSSSTNSSSTSTNKLDSNKKEKSSATSGGGGDGRDKPVKKKTVTFKNILVSSDDTCTVRKVYNPDNAPLVPIIKKPYSRSGRLSRTDCIVRPSRLTEILKNNANNIDKLNFLKFRSVTSSSQSSAVQSSPSSSSSSSASSNAMDSSNVPSLTALQLSNSSSLASSITTKLIGNTSSEMKCFLSSKSSDISPRHDNSLAVGDKRFILPKRSAHSCRVIKPNKRFLDDTEISVRSSKKNTSMSSLYLKKKSKKQQLTEDESVFDESKSHGGSGNGSSSNAQRESLISNTMSLKINNNTSLNEDGALFGLESETDDSISGSSLTATDESQSDFTEEDEDELRGSNLFRNNPFNSSSKSFLNSVMSSKIILRQPRLQYESQMNSVSFSLNRGSPNMGASPLGGVSVNSVYCGVCGTLIMNKSFQPARKFGISSCETCRKFISKIIKKLAASAGSSSPQSSNMIQCMKGDGSCLITPSLKGSSKTFKKICKERCPACWLKKCIKSYHVPSGLRIRLTTMLPASLRDNESNITSLTNTFSIKENTLVPSTDAKQEKSNNNLFANPPSKLFGLSDGIENTGEHISPKATLPILNPLAENNTTFGSSLLIKPTILEKPVFMSTTKLTTSNSENEKCLQESQKSPINPSSSPQSLFGEGEDGKIKLRRKDKESVPLSVASCDQPKRQKIDLKGPRVKHVCRSASIVLGQPIATFPNESPLLENMDTPPRPESSNDHVPEMEITSSVLGDQVQTCSTCIQRQSPEPDLGLSPPATPINARDDDSQEICRSTQEVRLDRDMKKSDENQKPPTRKISRPPLIGASNIVGVNPRNLNTFQRRIVHQASPVKKNSPAKISIDFWENYDPAEISQTGFGLIVTESFKKDALCFLCGSRGLDPLIFCACCCEPYHQYCVEDEYNLKHSSLDDTMNSLIDASLNLGDNLNIMTNRLNWLCPRCTVCYTCNMSSGSKVKCQKCQKNYHTTCLGTSKRLLGADRPLICATCLKCKSCGTTKVTKFVGNLPMCSQCFKLRKKGNFCPMCQRCYEDHDFDLKMMECGDCQRWVHAKCEGLSDEQYNLLSALPENIEFICKRCSKINSQANLWREAVSAEFKSGLLSVVKLLSKRRQACALLKLSPRKLTMGCICQPQNPAIRKIQFKGLDFSETCSSSSEGKPMDEESQNSEDGNMEGVDVYEFKEASIKCFCGAHQKQQMSLNAPNLVDVKRKINNGEYVSLAEFNFDMNNVITSANCDDLMIAYKEILSEAFPWFQNETKACTDALEEDMFDSCSFSQSSEGIECDQQVPVIDLPEDIDEYFYTPNSKENDMRTCMFCRGTGEGDSSQESRLLYCGQNSWVHINCAMWSAEVFEEIDGSLQNVHSAIARGRMIKCSLCGNRGATVGCNVKSCGLHYHYPCARKSDCAFMSDKTIYCREHLSEAGNKKATIERNFEVLRPVYVELDRKKKKLVEPSKVKFFIGSLEVKQLGKFFSQLSDTNEAIVPVNFLCSRLYWSIKEPWKIVEYTVKTSMQNNLLSFGNDSGRNFTVDHSNNLNMVQLGLAQIARWQNSLLIGEDSDSSTILLRQERSVKQLLEAVSQNVAQNVNSDEGTTEEEPQNNADLLPPEIKDAIFEDLPHEILDGISMLDIFPKLMIYEDMITIDPKENYYTNEYSKEGNISEEECNDTGHKDLDLSNAWPISTGIGHVEDAMLSAVRPFGSSREIKRSKSEIFPRGISGNRSQQRSSSLTWSCKLDTSSVKRRKISKGLQDIRLPEGVLLSIGRRKDDFPAALERRRGSQNDDIKNKQFTWSAAKKYAQLEIPDSSEKFKISQLDGMDDITGENELTDFRGIQRMYDIESPVKCDRCNCTYRTHDSYERHLATCEPLSTSESESETAPRSPDADTRSPGIPTGIMQMQQPLTVMQNFNNTINSLPITSVQSSLNSIHTVNSFGQSSIPFSTGGSQIQNIQIQNFQSNGIPVNQLNHINQGLSNILLGASQNGTQITSNPTITTSGFDQSFFPSAQNFNQLVGTVSAPGISSNTQTISVSSNGLQQTQPQIVTVTTSDGNQQLLTIGPQQTLFPSQNKINQQNSTVYSKSQPIRPQIEKASARSKQLSKIQQSPSKVKQKPTNTTKPIQLKKSSARQDINANRPIQIINQTMPLIRNSTDTQGIMLHQNTNPQSIIVQQVANPQNNIVQYLTADGNQMQYVTMPSASGEFKQPQTPFLTTSPLVQGTFLQTDTSGNLVLTNASSGLQMISTAPLQIAPPTQPQVIGTLIQPQALQCGVMSTEQMVLGSTPTLEMVTNPAMLLASQPVYYGLETIVQNTVMSSQQFVSTAMQGVLSQNASFSATTTQVFQASKIEPIMEVPAGYVVLNNVDGTIMQQPTTTQTNIISTNVLQQPIQQIQTQSAPIQAQTIQPQQIQSLYNISQPSQQQIQQASQTIQAHQIQPQLRAVSPAKPVAKSSPIVVTKIQPQIMKKVIPNVTAVQTQKTQQSPSQMVQENMNSSNQIILSKPVTLTQNVDQTPIIVTTAASGVSNVTKVVKSNSMMTHHPLKPKVNSSNSSLMPIQPVQRKTNMIRPLNKISAISIKPKIVTKPVTVKNSSNVKSMQSPPPIAPKPQRVGHNQRLLQSQIITQPTIEVGDRHLHGETKTFEIPLASPDSGTEMSDPGCNVKEHLLSPSTASMDSTSTSVSNQLQNFEAISNTLYSQQQNNHQTMTLSSSNQCQTINLPTSSSIQLPSAPFISPYGNNIPTNIVNPIQQQINAPISRPTNRVLPMQTVQQKMSPPTPPEFKLCSSKSDMKDEEHDKDIKQHSISNISSSVFEFTEKTDLVENAESPNVMDSIIDRSMEDAATHLQNSEENTKNRIKSDFRQVLTDNNIQNNDFGMKGESDDMPDQDDLSGSTTPEVKEKICEILENLENEECNKSPLLDRTFDGIVCSHMGNEEKENLTEYKENVDPDSGEIMNMNMNVNVNKISNIPMKSDTLNQKFTGPRLLYEIQSEDGFTYKSTSITEVWEKVFEAVQVARKAHGLAPLPEGPLADMCGVQMLGLKTNALRYLIEQLPGVERCKKYTPKYHKKDGGSSSGYSSDQEDLKENIYGSARCEPFVKRSEYDMFSWLASRHRKQPVQVIQAPETELIPRRGTGSNLPMAMKYRTLKETYKDYVGVFRSHIHGRGLYCTKDIEAGEMVIEYAGELIRSTLTDKRERYYDSKGIGCYMFKIDENLVVDATMRGNAARFINHSCEPNCYSKVVDILGHKHIIIFALRRIVQGEELTYDYKFPFEDVKIPCSCGSKKCRKYLN